MISTNPRPILFDTDIGSDVDDALALVLILAPPELDLRCVTTVAADTALRTRVPQAPSASLRGEI